MNRKEELIKGFYEYKGTAIDSLKWLIDETEKEFEDKIQRMKETTGFMLNQKNKEFADWLDNLLEKQDSIDEVANWSMSFEGVNEIKDKIKELRGIK